MGRFWAKCILAGWIALSAGSCAGPSSAQDEHPDLVRGELSNGLAYMILPMADADGLSFRLMVQVGSQAEGADNRGVAHFVEHMAFRSTRNFADGEIEQVMAQAGAASGWDHNAFTGRWTTTYHLDLPTPDAANMARGLDWLRDVGDGQLFRPEEVAAERGVILAERLDRLRSGDATDEQETSFHFRPEDNLTPAGSVATLTALTPDDLRVFHAKWYRPDRSVIIVTGDLDADDMAAELERRLGGWAGAGARPRIPTTPAPEPPKTPAALVLTPGRLPAQSLACRNTPVAEDDAYDPAEELRETLLLSIVNQRLSRAAAATPGIYYLGVEGPNWYETRQVACARATHAPHRGLEGLRLAQATLRSFAAEGPTQAEIDAAVASQRAYARGALTSYASATAAEMADELIRHEEYGRPFLAPHQTMRQISRVASSLTPEALVAAFEALWPETTPPTLSVEDTGLTPPAVAASWRAGAAAPLAASFPPPEPLIYDFGPEGRVVRREVLAQGVVRVTFANGLVLKHMATENAPGFVQIRIRMGPGGRELSPEAFVLASAAAAVLPAAGVEGRSFGALQELNAEWDWEFEASLSDAGLVVSAQSFASQTPAHMAVIMTHLITPGFDAELADSLALLAASLEQEARLNPVEAVETAFARTIWPDTAGAAADPDTYRRLDPADLKAALTPFLTTGPVELTLVGDISEDDAILLAARSLGARPARPPHRPRPERPPLDYSAAPPRPIEVTHQGPAGRSAAHLYWTRPAIGPIEERAAAMVLTALLETAVVEETRRRQGRTYSPTAQLDGSLTEPHDIALYVEVTPEARRLDDVIETVRQAAAGFVAAPPTAEAFEQARRPMLTQLDPLRGSDLYWAKALGGPVDWDTQRKELDRLGQALARLTPADVHALARPWLSTPPIIVLARPAAAPLGDPP
ncbi:M16 family metallopeptidase [Phenylobacterium sp.]|uniref:M16 family metallopeptidase n=1 Tax=Phenylobacterium sp. TaxID=1871053 RepID=UPI003001312D